MYQKTGLTIIEEGLELKDFTWSIQRVIYDWGLNKVYITVKMCEPGKTISHIREFEFDAGAGDWGTSDALQAVLNHDTFKGSITQA